MAIEKLRTDFEDDILAPSMSGKRQYIFTENSNGTTSIEDASLYLKVGDDYGKEQINKLNQTVNELIDGLSDLETGATTVKKSEEADSATVAESVENDFILVNKQTLEFTNKVCAILNAKITADSLADVYFTSDSVNVAENAVITVETYSGKVVLSAGRTPEGQIKATIHIRVV